MIRLRQINISIFNDSKEELLLACSKKLKIEVKKIKNYKIIKKSIDARHKPNIIFSYEVDILVDNEDDILKKSNDKDISISNIKNYEIKITGTQKLKQNPIIIGSGPCGLFSAYILATAGYNPIVIERGEDVDKRIESVINFWETGILNTNSNVQFGEGGAGTFSDGKLNTTVKDPMLRGKKVLEIFVENGAPEEILYINKPHIGTDLLRNIVKNMRKKIISLGGNFRFNTCLTNIFIENNQIKQIELNNNEIVDTDILILAIGHSARDTFYMLNKKLEMSSKPFAIGVRIQHPQSMINENQYGKIKQNILPNASYKLTYKASNNRGVYTFCMCPGGYVVNSSSENGLLAINGMSNYKRESQNANSSIIVTVNPSDFGNNPLDGIEFQRKLEKLAYQEGNGLIPVQLYKDFKNNIVTKNFGEIKPIFKGNYSFSNIQNILPNYVTEALIEGIEYFNRKINGYSRGDAILSAIESRTSSPVRIIRDENLESNIKGIYPCGEGAGYAGGITSAAIDGIKVADEIFKKYIK